MGIWHVGSTRFLALLLHLLFCTSIHGISCSSASLHSEFQAVAEPALHVSLAFGGSAPCLRLQGDTKNRRTSGSGCCGQRVSTRVQCVAVGRWPRLGINTGLLALKGSSARDGEEEVEPVGTQDSSKEEVLRENPFVRISADAREKMTGFGWRDDTMNQTVGRVGKIVQFLGGGTLSGQTLCIVSFENTTGIEWVGRKVLLMSCLEAADPEKGAKEEGDGGGNQEPEPGRVRAGAPTQTELVSDGGLDGTLQGVEDEEGKRLDLIESVMDLDAMVQESASRLDQLVSHAKSELGSRNVSWDGIVEETTFGQEVERVRGELKSIRYGVEDLLDSSLRFGDDQRIGMPEKDMTELEIESAQASTELDSLFDADGFREGSDSRVGMPQDQQEKSEDGNQASKTVDETTIEGVGEILSSLQFPGAPPGAEASTEKARKTRSRRAARTPRIKQVAVSETQYVKVMEYVEGDDDDDEIVEAEPQLRMEEGPSVDYTIIPRPFYYPKADVDVNPIYASFRNGSGIVEIQSEAKSKYEKLWVLKSKRVVREAILEKEMREAERQREREKLKGEGGVGGEGKTM